MTLVIVLDVNVLRNLPENIEGVSVNRSRGDGIVSFDVPGQIHNEHRPADLISFDVLDQDANEVVQKIRDTIA